MAVCRGFLLLLAFVGSVSLILLSFYRWDMTQENTAERVDPLQVNKARKQHLRQMCSGHEEEFSDGKHRVEDIKDFWNFVVDDIHGILYCYIPKVACTNWKKVMFVLSQGEPYYDPQTVPYDLVHYTNNLTLLRNFPKKEIEERLKHYTKFMFVRDPFVRLISAYRDKFQRLGRKDYYVNYGRQIMRQYGNVPNPPLTEEEAFKSGVRPSFYNFIQYLLDPQTESRVQFEPHWRQMHRLCHPCLIQYDYVGHQETLSQDAEQLLKLFKVEDTIKMPPSYEHMTSPDSVVDWFKTVPLEDRRELYKLYEKDFKLFGYRRPDELLDG